jgi:hypothetical protein
MPRKVRLPPPGTCNCVGGHVGWSHLRFVKLHADCSKVATVQVGGFKEDHPNLNCHIPATPHFGSPRRRHRRRKACRCSCSQCPGHRLSCSCSRNRWLVPKIWRNRASFSTAPSILPRRNTSRHPRLRLSCDWRSSDGVARWRE